MAQLFKNDARANLASAISPSDTSLVLEAGYGDLFPVANMGTGTVGDWFKTTLEKETGEKEIIRVRTRSSGSDILSNVLRAQEGTTAMSFDAATSVVGLRLTADDIQSVITAAELMASMGLRPIPDWSSVIAAATGYPNLSVVMHNGVSWKSIMDANAAEPGTDLTRWVRWAELVQTTNPTCGATGPVPTDDRSLTYISTGYGELWSYVGIEWRVVSRKYGTKNTITAGLSTAAVNHTPITSFTAHRAGKVIVSVAMQSYGTANPSNAGVGIGPPAGVEVTDLSINYSAPNWHHTACTEYYDVTPGQIITIYYAGSAGRTNSILRTSFQYID